MSPRDYISQREFQIERNIKGNIEEAFDFSIEDDLKGDYDELE